MNSSLIAVATLLVFPAVAPFDGGATASKKVALLVGVQKYDKPGFEELPGAENDAKALDIELKKLGFTVHVLLGSGAGDDRATLANLRKRLKSVAEPLTKQDILIVTLAGHGQQIETTDAEKRTVVGDYFCPVGAVSGDAETMFPLDDLLTTIGANVGQGIVLIDACRDEPDDPNRSTGGRRARIRTRGIQGRQITVPSGMSVLFSCAERQRAFEHPSEKHGLFTFCLLEELRKAEGDVVWLSLANGVTERMASPEVAKILPAGRHQNPVLASNVGRIVLGIGKGTGRDRRASSDPQMTATNRPRSTPGTGTPRGDLMWSVGYAGTVYARDFNVSIKQPIVRFVVQGGGADLIGLKKGDAILKVDEKSVDDERGLSDVSKGFGIGEKIKFEVRREGLPVELSGAFESRLTDDEALARIQESAEAGDGDAQYYLARLYSNPWPFNSIKVDERRAERWMQKAAGAGIVEALSSPSSWTKDPQKIIDSYRAAIEKGDYWCHFWLGREYRDRGEFTQSFESFKKAHEFKLGCETELALCYLCGSGVERDESKGLAVFQQGMKPWGIKHLAKLYFYGIGVGVDHANAQRYLDEDDQGSFQRMIEEEKERGYSGVKLSTVVADSPAEWAGLRGGDVLIEVNGFRTRATSFVTYLIGYNHKYEKKEEPMYVIYIEGSTGKYRMATVLPKEGKIGITMEEVTLNPPW